MSEELPDISGLVALSEGWWGPKDNNSFSVNQTFFGPIHDSNVIIPGILYAGWFPSVDEVQLLRGSGINLFVSLLGANEVAEKNLTEGNPTYFGTLPPEYLTEMVWVDMQPINVNELLEKCKEVAGLIREGRRAFVHCAGGHGRTGTFICVLLYILYYGQYDVDQILQYVQYAHDQRESSRDYLRSGANYARRIDPDKQHRYRVGQIPSPQTSAQQNLVQAACSLYDKEMEAQQQAQEAAQQLIQQHPGNEAEINEQILQQLNQAFGIYADEVQELLEGIDQTDIEKLQLQDHKDEFYRNEDENNPEKEGGRRKRKRKTRKSRKSRKSKKSRKSRKSRK